MLAVERVAQGEECDDHNGSVRFQYTTHWSLVPSPHGPQNSCWFATLASHIRLKRASDCHHSPHGG